MDLPLIPPPVPVPTRALVKEFYKSKIILFLAYIQIVVYGLSILTSFLPMILGGQWSGFSHIIFIVPALIIVFAKNELAYKIARVLMIVEYVILIFLLTLLFIIFRV